MRFGNRGELAGEAGGLMVGGQGGEIEGDGFGSGRQRRQSLTATPSFEKAPVGAVGAAVVVGLGGCDEATGLVGQTVQGSQCPALRVAEATRCVVALIQII